MALQSWGRSALQAVVHTCGQNARQAPDLWLAAVGHQKGAQIRCMCYASPKPASGTTAPRRVVSFPGSQAAAAAAGTAEAESSASTSGPSLAEMDKEVPGGRRPMATWEKWYWGVGVVAVSAMLFKYLTHKPPKTPEELQAARKAAEESEAARKEQVRAAIMTNNFLKGDKDPLDGLSPAMIEKFLELASIDPDDPLEGLTPEEIDAYMKQHALEDDDTALD